VLTHASIVCDIAGEFGENKTFELNLSCLYTALAHIGAGSVFSSTAPIPWGI